MGAQKVYNSDSERLEAILSKLDKLENLVCDPENPHSHHAKIIRIEERLKYISIVAAPIIAGAIGVLIKFTFN